MAVRWEVSGPGKDQLLVTALDLRPPEVSP
jgi:hypothetical protein